MKKLKLILPIILAFYGINAFAQLSTRVKDSSTFKFATRPQKGDKALFTSFVLKDTSLKSLKLIDILRLSDKLVFKYYLTENNVFRANLNLNRSAENQKGIIADSSFYNPLIKPHLKDNRYKIVNSQFILKPGFEKHIKTSNVIDVYAGADIWIGFSRMNVISNTAQTNGDYSQMQMTMNQGLIGGNAFTGFNIFIAKLPLSIGMEYGWNGLTQLGNKMKVSVQDQIGSGTNTTKAYADEYYINPKDVNGLVDAKLYERINRSSSNFGLNQTIRLTANIYFK
jgi:hypothetical protein